MLQITAIKSEHQCTHCARVFQRENSLIAHTCEQKRRFLERDEVGVSIGLQSYLRFYQITQGSVKIKTWADFAKSPYYKAFVKFGRYCQSINAINISRFIDWLINNNKKIDQWCSDKIYTEYLIEMLLIENEADALTRAIEYGIDWSEKNSAAANDCLRYSNPNTVCYAITIGKISPWVIYNCESGQKFLSELRPDQVALVWPYINSDSWYKKFQEYPTEVEFVKHILKQAGW